MIAQACQSKGLGLNLAPGAMAAMQMPMFRSCSGTAGKFRMIRPTDHGRSHGQAKVDRVAIQSTS